MLDILSTLSNSIVDSKVNDIAILRDREVNNVIVLTLYINNAVDTTRISTLINI